MACGAMFQWPRGKEFYPWVCQLEYRQMFHVKHLGTIEQKGAAVPEKIVLTRDLEHDPFCRIMLPLTLGRCAPGAMAVRSAQWR
jgi:hypothetical protein